MKKRLVICLLAVVLVLGLAVSASAAEGDVVIKVGSINASSDATGSIEIPVTITNNPGFAGFDLNVSYDTNALTLTQVKAGIAADTLYNAKISCGGITDFTGDGTIFTLVFDILPDGFKTLKTGTSTVTLTPVNTAKPLANAEGQIIQATYTSGGIEVTHIHSAEPTEDAGWDINVPATCTEDGYTSYTCEYCNEEVVEARRTLTKLGHNYDKTGDGNVTDDDAVIVSATCTTDGSKTFTCQREDCGYTDVQTIAQTGHHLVKDASSVDTTCDTDGRIVMVCDNEGCDYSETTDEAAYHHKNAYKVDASKAHKNEEGEIVLGCIEHYYCPDCDTYFKVNPVGKTSDQIDATDIYGTGEEGKAAVTVSRIAGDVNDDGDVDNLDVTRLRRNLAGYTTNSEINVANANVNGDEDIDNLDVTRLRRHLAGYTTNSELQ